MPETVRSMRHSSMVPSERRPNVQIYSAISIWGTCIAVFRICLHYLYHGNKLIRILRDGPPHNEPMTHVWGPCRDPGRLAPALGAATPLREEMGGHRAEHK